MARIPKFEMEAFDTGAEDKPLGKIDLTAAAANTLSRHPRLAAAWLDSRNVLVSHLAPIPDEAAQKAAFAGNLSLPGFAKVLGWFLQEAGGVEAMPRLSKALRDVGDAKMSLKRAEVDLKQVRLASWEDDEAAFEMLYSPHLNGDFVSERDGAFDDWIWMGYANSNPVPPRSDDSEYMAWADRAQEWLRQNAPPFLFGTTPIAWKGIDAADVRITYEDEGEVDVWALVESGLADHHEDAEECIQDPGKLDKIIEEWLPHAEKGTPGDLALEAKIAEWNARQDIVSHYPDTGVIVPAWDGTTHETAIAWSERRVEAAQTRVAEAEDAWPEPDSRPYRSQADLPHAEVCP